MKQQYLDYEGLTSVVNNLKQYVQDNKTTELYDSRVNFPSVGKESTIYIDKTANMLYRWDDENIKYYSVGFSPDDIEIIDGNGK